jgi:AcrR family transcriptional regulator
MTGTQAREADRTRLTKQAVVERALALGDAEGLDAITYRRLAAELGVTPMALYWHFKNKEVLLAGLADQVWSEIETEVDPAAEWHVQLRGLLESLLRVLRAHPCASQLLVAGEKQSSAALIATETALAVLRRGGFDPEHAAKVASSTLWTGLMLVMSQPGFEPGLSKAECAEMQRRSRVRLALLPPEEYPHLVESAGTLTAWDDPEFHYRFGVDLFVAGVRAMASRPQAGAARPQRSVE